MVNEGNILGHKISRKGIEVDKAKIETIEKLPSPTSIKGIRSFLSHAGFYSRFIKDLSTITKPFSSILMQGVPFHFEEKCKLDLATLKDKTHSRIYCHSSRLGASI